MKIAFWSGEKQVDTAFHMSLVACASVSISSLSIAVASGGYNGKELEKSFSGKRKDSVLKQPVDREYENTGQAILAAEQQEYFLAAGLDCLLGKQKEELTKQVVRANMQQIIKERMYYLPTSRKREQEWWQEDSFFVRLKQVMDAVEDCFDVIFIDCGNRKDDFTQSVLQEADVCVLNMNQESELIGDYYRNPPGFSGKVFFLVGNYFKDGLYTRKNLERLYRVDENMLGAIPYNLQMKEAARTGRTEAEVKKHMTEHGKGRNFEFAQELIRTTKLILRMAGIEV